MLPLSRDRSPLGKEELRRLEEQAENAVAGVPLEPPHGDVFIAYAGNHYARAAAAIMFWPLLQIAETRHVSIAPVEAFTHHYTAYREEEATLILVAEHGAESIIARTLATARIMQARVAAVIGPPLPGPASVYAEDIPYIDTGSERPGLYTVLAAAKLVARLLGQIRGVQLRVDRIRREFGDIAAVYDQLADMYKEQLSALREAIGGDRDVYYTPTMEAPAAYVLYLAVLSSGRVYTAPVSSIVAELAIGKQPRNPLILATDAEQDVVREARFKLGMKGSRLVEITLHTDPLTAPIYGVLLAEAARASTP